MTVSRRRVATTALLLVAFALSGSACPSPSSPGAVAHAEPKQGGTPVSQDILLKEPLGISGLGAGVNTLSGSSAGSCVVPVEVPAVVARDHSVPDAGPPNAGHHYYRSKYMKTVRELKESLGLSASASFGAGLYGANVKYLTEVDATSESSFLELESRVDLGYETASNFKLTPEALKKLSERGGVEQFIATCGDAYVFAVQRGAFVRGFFALRASAERAKSRLELALKGGGAGWNADASFQKKVESALQEFDSESWFQQGGALQKAPLDMAALIKRGAELPTDPNLRNLAIVTEARARSYTTAVNFPKGVKWPDLRAARSQVEVLAPPIDSANVAIKDIELRLARPGRLGEPACDDARKMLLERKAELEKFASVVRERFRECTSVVPRGTPPKCFEALPPVTLELPRIDAQCGPRCTGISGAQYETDSRGYCTRCVWRYPGDTNRSVGSRNGNFSSTCSFMRRGSRLMLRAKGLVWSPVPSGTYPWVIIALDAKSGRKNLSCTSGDCWWDQPNGVERL